LIPKPLVDLYATHDAEVSPYLVGLTPVEVTRAVRQWVTRAEAITEGPDSPGEAGARVHLSRTLDGRGVLDATLDPDTTTLAETALRIAERPDTPGESLTATERRGEAFGRVMRFYCDHGAAVGDRPGRQHPQVAVVVDPFDLVAGSLRGLGIRTTSDFERFLAVRGMGIFEEGVYRDAFAHAAGTPHTHDGHPLTATSLARLFDQGTLVHRVLMADGVIIDRGRTLRLASPNLRDALLVRDQGCRFPHCDTPAEWVHAHHLQHWENEGPTDLANLAGLCATHHGVVHRDRWHLTIEPDGSLTFTRPDGHTLTSPPPRRHRPPPLPLHHPKRHGVIATTPEPDHPVRRDPSTDPEPHDLVNDTDIGAHGEPEHDDERELDRCTRDRADEGPDDRTELDRRTRDRVVELVRHHRHHTDRHHPDRLPTWTWPETG